MCIAPDHPSSTSCLSSFTTRCKIESFKTSSECCSTFEGLSSLSPMTNVMSCFVLADILLLFPLSIIAITTSCLTHSSVCTSASLHMPYKTSSPLLLLLRHFAGQFLHQFFLSVEACMTWLEWPLEQFISCSSVQYWTGCLSYCLCFSALSLFHLFYEPCLAWNIYTA